MYRPSAVITLVNDIKYTRDQIIWTNDDEEQQSSGSVAGGDQVPEEEGVEESGPRVQQCEEHHLLD